MEKKAKRIAATTLAAAMIAVNGLSVLGAGAVTSNEASERELRNSELSMELATSGMVLMENKNNTLPLETGGNIALFGNGAYGTVKGGVGSGNVNQRDVVNVYDGLKNAGYTISSEQWISRYAEIYDAAQEANTDSNGVARVDEIEISDEELEAAKENTDTAIYVVARLSGEAVDRTLEGGDYYLSDLEKENLAKLAENFEHCIVLLNTGGVMDMKFVDEIQGIDAVLLMSQAGMRGGDAVAKIITGEVTPSGKLVDTWPVNYEDYPTSETFAFLDDNVEEEVYTEGIYVGYRYFDTFNVTPAYEFGYGLSYTDFDIEVTGVEADANNVTITAEVTNTGDTYSGKEVVEVYFSAPDGELEKPYQELAAFGKTDELAPGESQTLTISYKTTEMSSYSEEKAAYIMEPGDYLIRVGNSSRNTEVAAVVELDQVALTEQLSNQVEPEEEVTELSREGVDPYSYPEEESQIEEAQVISLSAGDIVTENNASPYDDETVTAYVSDTTETEYLAENLPYELASQYHGPYEEKVVEVEGDFSQASLKEVYDGTITMEEFVSGLTVSQMADIVIGGNKLPSALTEFAGAASENANNLGDGTIIGAQANSVAGAAGETAGIYLESKDIPNIVLADGPAGLRITNEYEQDGTTYYQYCTAWPIGTLIAMSWDPDVAEAMGKGVGEELSEFGITLWLAPGLNIHRDPLCGRNFEYFSEDPYLTGMMGSAETKGVQSYPGVGVTLKHYAANSQESNRSAVDSVLNERAYREIYLKGFEMIVKSARPMAIMTGYNVSNGVPTGDDYDLCTDLARGEWGFDGLIMTDWGGGKSTPGGSMHAGNDLIMPGESVEDITVWAFSDEPLEMGEDGIYPPTSASCRERIGLMRRSFSTDWGEFVPDENGTEVVSTTVSTEDYETATREYVDIYSDATEVSEILVSELIDRLGGAAEVIDNGDGTTTINYKGYYLDNNICLGDLQRCTANVLRIVMASNQFADLFDDVEAVSYTEARADQLETYQTVTKS